MTSTRFGQVPRGEGARDPPVRRLEAGHQRARVHPGRREQHDVAPGGRPVALDLPRERVVARDVADDLPAARRLARDDLARREERPSRALDAVGHAGAHRRARARRSARRRARAPRARAAAPSGSPAPAGRARAARPRRSPLSALASRASMAAARSASSRLISSSLSSTSRGRVSTESSSSFCSSLPVACGPPSPPASAPGDRGDGQERRGASGGALVAPFFPRPGGAERSEERSAGQRVSFPTSEPA